MILLGALLFTSIQAPAIPPGATVPAPAAMNCDLGYDALVRQIAATPRILSRAPTADNPLISFYDEEKSILYFITAEGVPAHPTVVSMAVNFDSGGMVAQPSGCTFGRQDQTPQLLDMIDQWLRKARPAAQPAPPTGGQP